MGLVGGVLKLIEQGYVPDKMVRFGIQRLLKQRHKSLKEKDVVLEQVRWMDFIAHLKHSPIAVIPEVANQQHYEVPAEFFQKTLGPRLKYSCCWFENEKVDLAEAEEAMLHLTCQRAGLENGHRVLDLGCGWGSLSFWIVEKFPNCQVTAVSNSKIQRAFIESIIQQKKIKNLKVITADVNTLQLDATYDRIFSIEMFEHLRNYEQILEKCSSWLVSGGGGGKMFIHIFCHRNSPYFFETEGDDNWMGRYFFSQGSMPSNMLFAYFQKHLKLEHQWVVEGRHYETTCNAWLENFDNHVEEITSLFQKHYGAQEGKIWVQRWRMFFMSCAELFAYQNGQEWFVSHYLFNK